MGAGASRVVSKTRMPYSAKRMSGGGGGIDDKDVTLEDGSKDSFTAEKSWAQLMEGASKENNYYNNAALYYLKTGNFKTDKHGRYYTDEDGNRYYFDENLLYISNQINKAWEIQRKATGGSKDYMLHYTGLPKKENDLTDANGKVILTSRERLSQVFIAYDPRDSLKNFADRKENLQTYAVNASGRIVINSYVKDDKGKYHDMRSPKKAESSFLEDYNTKAGSSTKTMVGAILHEYGHSVQEVIMDKYPRQWDKFMSDTNYGRNQFVSRYAASYRKQRGWGRTSATDENFAEAYSAYVTNTPFHKEVPLTSKVKGKELEKMQPTDDYVKAFKQLMKECGIKPGV